MNDFIDWAIKLLIEFGIDYVSEVLKKCIRNSIKELINDKKGLHFCILSKRSCGYEVSKGLYLCDCVKSIDSTIEEIQSFNFVGTAWTNRHTWYAQWCGFVGCLAFIFNNTVLFSWTVIFKN